MADSASATSVPSLLGRRGYVDDLLDEWPQSLGNRLAAVDEQGGLDVPEYRLLSKL